ncbi:hypothetical protein CHUAL_002988 [Chamberlinius hualienensis]
MGLLTNPNTQSDRISKLFLKFCGPFGFISYVCGILWFMALSSELFNAETYISENALLPAMVDREFGEKSDIQSYLDGLKEEMDRYQNEMPTAWLQGQFRQLGLEVYMHNFTLKYPLTTSTYYEGKNIYAILRAPRASSTEALVLVSPFRSPIAVHPDTSPGIALMFALAKFFKQNSFWAKDIIFLITEHEQLGVKAWLEAYHGVGNSDQVLNSGVLPSQSGVIQAAINLEIHDKLIKFIDLKLEGLTGQLPNLDLVNLAVRLCIKENVPVTIKTKGNSAKPLTFKGWLHSFKNTMAMVNSQATGTPTGNHGIFLRYNIESLTLEGHQKRGKKSVSLYQVGRVVEGMFRSLNNLLESLHQSFFFYLLPSVDRYVSIGLYMPPLGLILLPLVLHMIKLLIKSNQSIMETDNKFQEPVSFTLLFVNLITSHCIGFGLYTAPTFFVYFGHAVFMTSTENSLLYGVLSIFVLSLFSPLLIFRFARKANETEINILKLVAILEATLLMATVSLTNYSLSLLVSTVTIPFILFVGPSLSIWKRSFKLLLLLLISPIGLVLTSVIYDTLTTYPEENMGNKIYRIYAASKRVLLYAVTDDYIYNNWIFPVSSIFYFPIWIQLWCTQNVVIKIKQN